MGFGVRSSGFEVWSSGFEVRSSGFGVLGSEFGVRGSGVEVWSSGLTARRSRFIGHPHADTPIHRNADTALPLVADLGVSSVERLRRALSRTLRCSVPLW